MHDSQDDDHFHFQSGVSGRLSLAAPYTDFVMSMAMATATGWGTYLA